MSARIKLSDDAQALMREIQKNGAKTEKQLGERGSSIRDWTSERRHGAILEAIQSAYIVAVNGVYITLTDTGVAVLKHLDKPKGTHRCRQGVRNA